MDYTPMNKEQGAAMKLITELCKDCVSNIFQVIKSCPGLYEKGYNFEIGIDTRYETIGNKIEIRRDIVKNDQVEKEQYYLQKGFGKHDKGWEELDCLCTEEFTSLFAGKEDGEGTEEGSTDESTVPSDCDPVRSDPDGDPVDGGR